MFVEPTCPLIGKSVQDAGLRHLPGLFLIEIDRKGDVITPVTPSDKLQEGDRLVFTGLVSTIVDLQPHPPVLSPVWNHIMTYPIREFPPPLRSRRQFVISRVGPHHPPFQFPAPATTRWWWRAPPRGERLEQKVGDVILRPGDTLLLQAGRNFERTFRGSSDFYLVSEVSDSGSIRHERA
ncbi:MAG: TrkA C-terminal domain-containing protein [Phycisphaerae bacterium]